MFSFLLIAASTVDGQPNDADQQSSRINSIKANRIVPSDSIEQPSDTDRIELRKYSSVNSKYVTQSTVTSDPPTVGLYPGSKKSEYKSTGDQKKIAIN